MHSPAESTLSDDEAEEGADDDDDDDDEEKRHYSFPELDARIRACVMEYGGVFPKLNFSSPKVRRQSHDIRRYDSH